MLAFLLTYEECDLRCADWDYVEDLLLRETADPMIERWGHSPSILIKNGGPTEIEMVGGAVFEMNKVLSKSDISLRFVREEPADITVTFVSHEALDKWREAHDYGTRIQGVCHSSVTYFGEIISAQILVSRYLPPGEKWGVVLHELGHAMGVSGHTDRYLSSLFYEDFKGGARSDGYSSDDLKLLEFLYLRVRPGARKGVVRTAFEKHWITRPQ